MTGTKLCAGFCRLHPGDFFCWPNRKVRAQPLRPSYLCHWPPPTHHQGMVSGHREVNGTCRSGNRWSSRNTRVRKQPGTCTPGVQGREEKGPRKRVWRKEGSLRPDPLSPFCNMLSPPHQGTQGSSNGWEVFSRSFIAFFTYICLLFLLEVLLQRTFPSSNTRCPGWWEGPRWELGDSLRTRIGHPSWAFSSVFGLHLLELRDAPLGNCKVAEFP